jgi:hypothetical protein
MEEEKEAQEATRLYVKKGKLFEDTSKESRVTASHVPIVQDFIAEKEIGECCINSLLQKLLPSS